MAIRLLLRVVGPGVDREGPGDGPHQRGVERRPVAGAVDQAIVEFIFSPPDRERGHVRVPRHGRLERPLVIRVQSPIAETRAEDDRAEPHHLVRCVDRVSDRPVREIQEAGFARVDDLGVERSGRHEERERYGDGRNPKGVSHGSFLVFNGTVPDLIVLTGAVSRVYPLRHPLGCGTARPGEALPWDTVMTGGLRVAHPIPHDPTSVIMARTILLAAVLLVAACELSVEPPARERWTAELHPSGAESSVAGRAAAIVLRSHTEASVGIEGASGAGSLAWRIHSGTCADPGEGIGPAEAYPTIEPGQAGTGDADTILSSRLETGQTYHVVIRRLEDGTPCGLRELAGGRPLTIAGW